MLIATKNNPKGPNIGRVESYIIDLSGSKLQFSMPSGNSTDLPEPQGIVIEKINIYQRSENTKQDSDGTVLADRWFAYKGFLGENLGSVSFMVQVFHIDPKNINLFNTSELASCLDQYHTTLYNAWNMKADEFCQISAPDSYQPSSINSINFLKYNIFEQQSTVIRSLYATPIADDCYVEFTFRYISLRDEAEPWYIMARQLEDQIMNSVNITLSNSATTAKASSI